MHESVMDFLRRVISPSDVAGKDVLEVGSRDVNGSPRGLVLSMEPSSYVGIDPLEGPGVDRVLDVKDAALAFGRNTFDLVISTEMLEHALDWRAAVGAMKDVVRPGGSIILTARGPGFPYHPHPDDFWRFTVADMEAAFADWTLVALEEDRPDPGFLLKATKPISPIANPVDLGLIEVARVL